jgi:hypothetical protein
MEREILQGDLNAAASELLDGLLKAASALRIILDAQEEIHRDRVTKPLQ